MVINEQEKSVFRHLLTEHIKQSKMLGFDTSILGVDVESVLSRLNGETFYHNNTGESKGKHYAIIESRGNIVGAIRAIRMLTGMGLKEAKDTHDKYNGRVQINFPVAPKASEIEMAKTSGIHIEVYGGLRV